MTADERQPWMQVGLRRTTAHQVAHATLRRAILSGDLPGGTRLVQAQLAHDLRLSTTPIREALRDLAAEGLIELDPHRGAVVRRLSLGDLREIYHLRLILEPEAMILAARNRTDEELARADELQSTMDSEVDPVAWTEMNREFHGILIRASRSPRMIAVLEQLRDVAMPYVAMALRRTEDHRFEVGNSDHRELLGHVRARLEKKAAAVTRRHLEATLSRLVTDEDGLGAAAPQRRGRGG
jgi:DNA-binding GntR family transcriptional regulator